MGKVKVGLFFFYLIRDILTYVLQKCSLNGSLFYICSLNSPLFKHMYFVQTANFYSMPWQPKH